MNQYFLLIACLQLWSLITPVNPASTWGPLIFIFAVSATKEAWDDYNRYLSDKKANEKEVWVVKQGIKKLVRKPFFFPSHLTFSGNWSRISCFCSVCTPLQILFIWHLIVINLDNYWLEDMTIKTWNTALLSNYFYFWKMEIDIKVFVQIGIEFFNSKQTKSHACTNIQLHAVGYWNAAVIF